MMIDRGSGALFFAPAKPQKPATPGRHPLPTRRSAGPGIVTYLARSACICTCWGWVSIVLGSAEGPKDCWLQCGRHKERLCCRLVRGADWPESCKGKAEWHKHDEAELSGITNTPFVPSVFRRLRGLAQNPLHDMRLG